LVTKVHREVQRFAAEDYDILLIGHEGHEEVEGTAGEAPHVVQIIDKDDSIAAAKVRDPKKLIWLSQTTLSVDDAQRIVEALRQRFPSIVGPKKDDICYATQNRQDAVKFMARQCDLVIVVGSPNSSNSNRLREVAAALGCEAYMVDGAAQLQPSWVNGKLRVGVTAGASAPEVLVQAVVQRLKELGAAGVTQLDGIKEGVTFPLPKGLALPPSATQGV
jgi:4-hydroxy-3-methylbut-2-enyl diphosphate reductase